MNLTLATLSILFTPVLAIAAVSVLVRRQLASLRRRLALPLDWSPELSVDRYRPMLRLLADDDIRFLQAQPGVTPALVKRLRQQRYRVFQGYLASLQRDFRQACAALTHLAVHSPTDRRDMLSALLASRWKFSLGVFRVRILLILYRWSLGQEPVARLVNLFEGLQLELIALIPDATANSAA